MASTTGTTAYNRPHQPAIHYSARGYEEHRADLIRRLAENGFVVKEGEQDFLNTFIDLTAYLGEVLMTYQNAYAQEIYLETAQLRESLFGLARVVDYRIRPGSAATGTLVVMAKSGKSGLLPKGFLVSGKEESAPEDVFFETDAAMQVDSLFNDFSLAEGERFSPVEIDADSNTNVTKTLQEKIVVKPGQYIYCKISSPEGHYFAQVQSSDIDDKTGIQTLSFLKKNSSLTGSFRASSGKWGLIHNDARGIYRLENPTTNTSEIWLDNKYEDIIVGSPVVLRGDDAGPVYGTVTEISFGAIFIKTGTSTRTSENATPATDEIQISNYDIYVHDTANTVKHYYIFEKTYKELREVCKITVTWLDSSPNAYPDNATTNPAEKSQKHFVFLGLQAPLVLKIEEENTDGLKGQSLTSQNVSTNSEEEPSILVVDGDFSSMEKYRTLIVHEENNGEKIMEQVVVFSASYDDGAKTSTITLRKPIDGDFTKCRVRIWGNVVTMTQGKAVKGTILGSGQGEQPYQTFDVPRSPLTFEMHGKEGLEGAIDIKVSDLVWTQQDDFLDSKPGDRHYMIETDYAGKSRVVFGDGVNGSRLPTGKDNVVARFRTGQGTNGNVSAGILKKAASKPPFLDKVSNPDKTSGGSDPDTEGQLREKIPTQHITFDRAVSLQDYADLALSCSGVSKAKAGWRWLNNRAYVVLAVAGSGGEDLSPDALKVLREYVDARRDPNQPLLVKQVDIVPIELSVSVTASEGYDTERVEDAVTNALGTERLPDGTYAFFSFDRLNIGMSIHKKDVYKMIEDIPGVDLVTHLEITRSTGPAGYLKPSFCPDDVWIHNWELPELDVKKRDITVTAKPVGTLCEKVGG